MKIKIRTADVRFSLRVPSFMIRLAARLIPNRAFEEMRTNIPEPYCALITKQNIRMLLIECLDIFKENKGLEIVHVEAEDDTFVSVKL